MSDAAQIIKKFWPSKLRGQLILGIALVHLVLMTIFVIDLVKRQRIFVKKQNLEMAFSFVDLYGISSVPYIISNDFDELQRVTLAHMNFPNLKYAMILSPEGLVLAHTNMAHIGKKPTDSVSLQIKGLTGNKVLIQNADLLDIVAPIYIDNKIIGWARAGVGQEHILSNITKIVQDGIAYILIALIIGTFFAGLIGNFLTTGLYKMIDTVNKIKIGDRNLRVPTGKGFELSHLGNAFNQMLDEISAHENLMNMVFENMPVGVWILNENGDIISTNSAGKQIWSGAPQVGINDFGIYKIWRTDKNEIIAPENYPGALAVKKGVITLNEELRIESFDGRHKVILNSALPLTDKDGKIIGAIAINVDVTEEKKTTEQLTLSESILRSAFDYSAIGMCLVLPNGKFSRVNHKMCKIIGYTESELLSLSFQDITFPEDLNKDLSYLNQTLEGKIDTYEMDKRYIHQNGTIIWVHLSVSLVRDNQNKPLFFVSQIEDISERKKTEAQIKESEAKFRKLVEETLVGVFILQEGNFVYVNPQVEKITGYTRKELLSEVLFEQLIHKDDLQKRWKNYLSGVVTGNASGHYLLKAVNKEGGVLHIEVILSPITLENKPSVIGTIIDITERIEEEKRIHKAVTDAQEIERQKISMELHDNVKQIIAACLLNFDFLKMIVKEKNARPVIDNINSYLRDAIEELRRISHQLAPITDTSISIKEKIKTIVDTMNVSKNIEINYHFDEFKDDIKDDVQLAMYRIVQEQFTNILKHSNASLVDITVHRNNGDIYMSIEDNGVGFDSFKTKNGIGLENIKRRVQVLNGHLNIKTLPGDGCTLYVELPVN